MSPSPGPEEGAVTGRAPQGPSRPSPDAAAAINAFVDRGPFGVAVVDPDLRILLISHGLAALDGEDPTTALGLRVDEVLQPPYGALVADHLRRALDSGVPMVDVETRGTFADPHAARSFTSSFYRLDSVDGPPLGVVILITETTELRQAEAAARSAASQLDLLAQVTDALSGSGTVADVTQVAAIGAARAVGASAAMIMGLDDKASTLLPLSWTGFTDETVYYREPVALAAPLPPADALRSRTIGLIGSPADRDSRYPDLPRDPNDHQAWAFVPLVAQDRPVGVVILAWTAERQFHDTDVSLLSAVGRQCALALEQARILEAERDARRATEFLVELTRFVVEGSDDGVFAISNGNRILTVNRRFCQLMGLPEDSIALGGDASELLLPCLALVSDPKLVRRHMSVSRDRPTDTLALEFELRDGRILAGNSSPILDRHANVLGRVWYLRDDTERRAQGSSSSMPSTSSWPATNIRSFSSRRPRSSPRVTATEKRSKDWPRSRFPSWPTSAWSMPSPWTDGSSAWPPATPIPPSSPWSTSSSPSIRPTPRVPTRVSR
jgi:PAS domain-containing protein